MSQEMSSLATLSTENSIAQNLLFSELVKTFEDVKRGKVNFRFNIL
jgi:hypothetical protein